MKPTKQPKIKPQKPENYPAFIAACLELGLTMPICAANGGELLFAREFGRIWRTDYLFINDALGVKLAVEIEGGTWDNGAHNRGSGYLKNIQKYNAYSLLGYTLLRFTAIQAKTEPITCAKWVKCVLNGTVDVSLMEMSEAEKLEGEKIRTKRKAAKTVKATKTVKAVKSIKANYKTLDFTATEKPAKTKNSKPSTQSKLWLEIQDKNKNL